MINYFLTILEMFVCLWKKIQQQEKIQMIAIDTFF